MSKKPLPSKGGVGVGAKAIPGACDSPTPDPSLGREGLVRAALAKAADSLGVITDTPRLDAELLMAHALGISRETLILSQLDGMVPPAFAALLARRLAHEPLAYIVGHRDFWTISLKVEPGVLIPRPDSETLIDAAVDYFGRSGPGAVLDLGTGSGALLLATLAQWPSAHGLGVDQSDLALAVAQQNAAALGLAARARFQKGDWAQGIDESFDLILCNPPYVETAAQLTPEVLAEPHEALFSGVDGLDDYRRLIPQLPPLLAPGGMIAVEIGASQAVPVSDMFLAAGLQPSVGQDMGGRNRAILHFSLGKAPEST